MGFTSRVVPGGRAGVIAEAIAVAKVMASKSPVAVTSTKRLMIRESLFSLRVSFPNSDGLSVHQDARDHSVQEGLDYTAAWNM